MNDAEFLKRVKNQEEIDLQQFVLSNKAKVLAMRMAIKRGNLSLLQRFVENGFDLAREQYRNGTTGILYLAVKSENSLLLDYMLRSGVDAYYIFYFTEGRFDNDIKELEMPLDYANLRSNENAMKLAIDKEDGDMITVFMKYGWPITETNNDLNDAINYLNFEMCLPILERLNLSSKLTEEIREKIIRDVLYKDDDECVKFFQWMKNNNWPLQNKELADLLLADRNLELLQLILSTTSPRLILHPECFEWHPVMGPKIMSEGHRWWQPNYDGFNFDKIVAEIDDTIFDRQHRIDILKLFREKAEKPEERQVLDKLLERHPLLKELLIS